MNIRPEDRPKLIGIGAVILGLNIYVFATVVPRISGAQTVASAPTSEPPVAGTATSPAPVAIPTPGPSVAPATPTPAGGLVQPASLSEDLADDKDQKVPSDVMPDPFTPPAGASRPADPAPPAPARPPGAVAEPAKIVPPPPGAVAEPATMPPGVVMAPAAPAAPLPAVELKGLIDGTPAVAVFQIGGEIYNKLEGEKLPGGLVVARITEAEVILHLGKSRFVLDVGHSIQPGNDRVPSPTLVASTEANGAK